jgi:hypothetical protein
VGEGTVAVTVLRGTVPSGSGSGDGYGYGYGSGYGSGYGDGDGYGYGSGYGSGSGDYWRSALHYFRAALPAPTQARVAALEAAGALIGFWRSTADGSPANGGSSAPVKVGDVHRERGPLRDECGAGQLHATLLPTKWQGDRWWIVALIGERRGDDEKYWALEREILGECLWLHLGAVEARADDTEDRSWRVGLDRQYRGGLSRVHAGCWIYGRELSGGRTLAGTRRHEILFGARRGTMSERRRKVFGVASNPYWCLSCGRWEMRGRPLMAIPPAADAAVARCAPNQHEPATRDKASSLSSEASGEATPLTGEAD